MATATARAVCKCKVIAQKRTSAERWASTQTDPIPEHLPRTSNRRKKNVNPERSETEKRQRMRDAMRETEYRLTETVAGNYEKLMVGNMADGAHAAHIRIAAQCTHRRQQRCWTQYGTVSTHAQRFMQRRRRFRHARSRFQWFVNLFRR